MSDETTNDVDPDLVRRFRESLAMVLSDALGGGRGEAGIARAVQVLFSPEQIRASFAGLIRVMLEPVKEATHE